MQMPRYLRSSSLAAVALLLCTLGVSYTAAQKLPNPPPSDDARKKPVEDIVTMEKFVASADAGLAASAPAQSVFGFDKSLVETPRAISIIPDTQLQQFNITKSEDMVKVSPSTYSNFRFGLQAR